MTMRTLSAELRDLRDLRTSDSSTYVPTYHRLSIRLGLMVRRYVGHQPHWHVDT